MKISGQPISGHKSGHTISGCGCSRFYGCPSGQISGQDEISNSKTKDKPMELWSKGINERLVKLIKIKGNMKKERTEKEEQD